MLLRKKEKGRKEGKKGGRKKERRKKSFKMLRGVGGGGGRGVACASHSVSYRVIKSFHSKGCYCLEINIRSDFEISLMMMTFGGIYIFLLYLHKAFCSALHMEVKNVTVAHRILVGLLCGRQGDCLQGSQLGRLT